MSVAAVPQDACPLRPEEISFSTPSDEKGLTSEKVVSSFVSNTVTITLDRTSSLLGQRGSAALCIVDDDCTNPESKPCVKQLGSAKWIGPARSSFTEHLCEKLEAGRCRLTISGFEMASLDYSMPRLALSTSCSVRSCTKRAIGTLMACTRSQRFICCKRACLTRGSTTSGASFSFLCGCIRMNLQDANTTPWIVAENIGAEEGSATFLVPATVGWGYQLCWNTQASPGSPVDADSTSFREQFDIALSSISFLPLPVVRGAGSSRPQHVKRAGSIPDFIHSTRYCEANTSCVLSRSSAFRSAVMFA